jgi:hypothetical protein
MPCDRRWDRLVRRSAVATGIGAALVALALMSAPAAASPQVPSRGEGMQVLCSSSGYACTGGGYHGQSRWGSLYGRTGHNCTSYVSFRLAELGVAQPWRPMGDAGKWDDRGSGRVRMDEHPAIGAVAQWEGGSRLSPGGSGHVGYVESVDLDGTIEVTDDSYGGGTRRYRISPGSAYWPDRFLHIHDLVDDRPARAAAALFGGLRAATAPVVLTFDIFAADPRLQPLEVLDLVS